MLLEGSASYAHFEPVDELPAPTDRETPFLVRKTRSGFLLPGRMTHLTQSRDNMHTFRAGPEGATLVDFNTRFEGAADFGLFRYEDDPEGEPNDKFEGLHEAHWIEKVF